MTNVAAPFPGNSDFTRVYGWAYLLGDDENEAVGTQHLLRGLGRTLEIAAALEAYDVTEAVLGRMVRAEAPEPGSRARMLSAMVKPSMFSNAAAAALDRCQTLPALDGGAERGPLDVLLAVLGDSQCRAVAVLTDCGVDIDELRVALREGRVPARTDPLPVDLHRTRDALVGRIRYRPQGRGLLGLLQKFVLRIFDENFGAHPVAWVRLEADELAREKGHRMRSDDVLQALLNTHEVALAYPHLARSVQHKYGGGQALLAAGVDHARVRAVLETTDLGPDSVPLPAQMGDWPQNTRQILERLVCVEGNRGARALRALGVTRTDLDVLCQA